MDASDAIPASPQQPSSQNIAPPPPPALAEELQDAPKSAEMTEKPVEAESAVEDEEKVDDVNSSRGASTERSESAIKEIPMSGDRNRFSRSKSPKARWHNDNGEIVDILSKTAKEVCLIL